MSDLLPCPFCGSEPQFVFSFPSEDDWYDIIRCANPECGAQVSEPYHQSEKEKAFRGKGFYDNFAESQRCEYEVMRRWNKRVNPHACSSCGFTPDLCEHCGERLGSAHECSAAR